MTISADAMAWLMQRSGAEPGIWLATITCTDLATPVRLALNTVDVTSRGETYQASWFDLTLPGDTDEEPVAELSIPNVDREIGRIVADVTAPLFCSFELVRAGAPDNVVQTFSNLQLRSTEISALMVSGQLSAVQHDTEPYIGLSITPSQFPGLYD